MCALFFTSIPGFSQNFSFLYREVHQFIQIFLLFLLFYKFVNNPKFLKLFYFPLIFLIFIVFSFVDSKFDSDALNQVINICVALSVLVFIFLCIKNMNDLIILLKYIGVLAIMVSISGIIEYVVTKVERIEGSFSNPNYFALFVGVGWVLVYCFFSKYQKIIFLPIMVLAIILSGSRSALVFPVLMIFWQIYLYNKKLRYIFLGTVFLLATSLSIYGTSFIKDYDMSGSDAERYLFFQIAFNMALDHPWAGVGWGRYISEFSNYTSTVDVITLESGAIDVSQQERRVTHNDLLKILAELGFLAFIVSILFLIRTSFLLSKGVGGLVIFPCWAGMVLFSLAHNNLNTAYSWFFILLPWFVYYKTRISFRAKVDNSKVNLKSLFVPEIPN